MDPLSGVASVIAVVQLAQAIGGVLKTYYNGAREARADIDRLYFSISGVELLLVQAETFLDDASGAISQLAIEFENIRVLLKAPKIKSRIGRHIAQSLQWPFKGREIEKIVGIIEQHKSTLSIGLDIEMLDVQTKHSDILASIQDDIKNAQSDQDHQRILRWLSQSVPNPSQEHNAARDKHEKGTGTWLVESEEVENWTSNKNSLLWLSGGAGSGKSLLCSTVIEYLKNRARSQIHCISAVTYWYFSFATKETLNISTFLCSIIRDLCSKLLVIPSQVQDAWIDANNGQQRPTTRELLEILHTTLKHFDDVYLIVDAVDEYPRSERDDLLDTIQEMVGFNVDCLHFLVSSRREGDNQELCRKLLRQWRASKRFGFKAIESGKTLKNTSSKG